MAYENPPSDPAREQLETLQGVIGATLLLSEQLKGEPMAHLMKMHEHAARGMVDSADWAARDAAVSDLPSFVAEDAAAPQEPEADSSLTQTQTAYFLSMVAIERAVDLRNPGENPPISQRMRTVARGKFEEGVFDRSIPSIAGTLFDGDETRRYLV